MTTVGRHATLGAQALAWLRGALTQEPSDCGFKFGLWRNRDVQALIKRQFGEYHSNGYVRDIVGETWYLAPDAPRKATFGKEVMRC